MHKFATARRVNYWVRILK